MHQRLLFLKSLKVKSPILRGVFAEFIGTFILNAMGSSAGASYTLRQNHAPSDNFGASFATAMGLFLGCVASAAITGAHLNPMATIGFFSVGKIGLKKALAFICAQYSGAFLATAIIFANYYEAIEVYDKGFRSAYGENTSTGHIFTTFPGSHVSIGGALLDQTICAGILMFAIMSFNDSNNLNVPTYFTPLCNAFALTGLGVAFGLNCSAALSPARDFSARIFLYLVGYGSHVFRPLHSIYWLIGGVIGPHLGGILGAWTYFLLIELHHNRQNIQIN